MTLISLSLIAALYGPLLLLIPTVHAVRALGKV